MISMLSYAMCGICCVLVAVHEFRNNNMFVVAISCSVTLFRAATQEIKEMRQTKNNKQSVSQG